jgi:hypothetical protein
MDKDEIARSLIEWHFRIERALRVIYRVLADRENAPDEPIKLLEVNEATIRTGSVEAFGFAPTEEVPFPTVIAEITERDLQEVLDGRMELPEGWELDHAMLFTRPEAA